MLRGRAGGIEARAVVPFAPVGAPHGAGRGAHQHAPQRRRHRLRAIGPAGLDVHPVLPSGLIAGPLSICRLSPQARRDSRLTDALPARSMLPRGGFEYDRVMTSAKRDAGDAAGSRRRRSECRCRQRPRRSGRGDPHREPAQEIRPAACAEGRVAIGARRRRGRHHRRLRLRQVDAASLHQLPGKPDQRHHPGQWRGDQAEGRQPRPHPSRPTAARSSASAPGSAWCSRASISGAT